MLHTKAIERKLANFGEGVHVHHWRIEEANGPESQGVCKDCGAQKSFKNWLADTDFITNTEHREVYV